MEIFSIIFHLIAFLKDCMGVALLYIFLIAIFLVINDDGDHDDDANNFHSMSLVWVFRRLSVKKKTFKNLQVIPTLKKNVQNYLVEMYFYKLKL